jgi:hypothetical protein
MSRPTDRDWHEWTEDWLATATAEADAATDQVRDFVRRRSLWIKVWIATDAIIGAGFLGFFLHRIVTYSDPLERLAMGMLALITIGAVLFGWWNWRGAIRATGESTATFLDLSADRSRRLLRSIRAGWVLLLLQAAVFTPWVWHRLYGDGQVPTRGQELFGWGWLSGVLGAAAVGLYALRAWAIRDARALDHLRRELDDPPSR